MFLANRLPSKLSGVTFAGILEDSEPCRVLFISKGGLGDVTIYIAVFLGVREDFLPCLPGAHCDNLVLIAWRAFEGTD